jgi:hypothetical protein
MKRWGDNEPQFNYAFALVWGAAVTGAVLLVVGVLGHVS